jgi:hypothetical protein
MDIPQRRHVIEEHALVLCVRPENGKGRESDVHQRGNTAATEPGIDEGVEEQEPQCTDIRSNAVEDHFVERLQARSFVREVLLVARSGGWTLVWTEGRTP